MKDGLEHESCATEEPCCNSLKYPKDCSCPNHKVAVCMGCSAPLSWRDWEKSTHCAKCAGKEEKYQIKEIRCTCGILHSFVGGDREAACSCGKEISVRNGRIYMGPDKPVEDELSGLADDTVILDMVSKYYREFKNKGHLGWDFGKEVENMSVVKKIKNLAKSKDQKLLEKYDVVDECGDLLVSEEESSGANVVLEVAFEHFKDEIVEKLRKVEAEEDKKKK